MGIADDITKLRDAGKSDEQILDGLKTFSGTKQYADDITKLQDAKKSAKDIVDGIGSYDSKYGAEAQRGIVDKLTAPLRYGAAKAAEGYQSTLHETGNDGVTAEALGTAKDALAPKDYTPAHVTLNPMTWGDIPKAVAEGAPGMAPDLAAGAFGAAAGGVLGPIGAIGGGLIGATGSYVARNYGSDARAASVSNGGGADTPLTASDKARALLMGTVGGAASRLSLGALGTPAKAEAGSLVSQLLPQIGKGAAIDAGTGVAQEAAHQGIIDQKFDPSALGGAAVVGGATGATMRGVSAIKDVNAAQKFKDVDNTHANPVANDLISVESPHKTGSGEDSFYRMQKVSDDYAAEVKNALSSEPVKDRLAALKEHDPLDPTAKTLEIVQKDIAEGRQPSQENLALIHNRIGDVDTGGPAITDLLKRQDTLNQLKSKGNWDKGAETFTGGASSTKFVQNYLNPMSKFGALTDAGAIAYALSGHTLPGLSVMHALSDPVSAASVPVVQAGAFAGLHALDRVTGNRNPMELFTNRFSGDQTGSPGLPPGSPAGAGGGPTDGASIAAAVQAARASGLAGKVSSRDENIMAREQLRDANAMNTQFNKRQDVIRSEAEALNKTHDQNVAKAQKSADDLEKWHQNNERSDAAILNRQHDKNVAEANKSAEALEKFQQNNERADATVMNRQHDQNVAKAQKSAADLEKWYQNNERSDAAVLNRAHDRNVAEAQKSADALEKFNQNQEHKDAAAMDRKRDASIRSNDSAAQSLDAQRSAAFVKEQVRLESAKAALEKQKSAAMGKQVQEQADAPVALDRQRSAAFVKEQVRLEKAAADLQKQKSAAMGKEAATEFNGPSEDATLRIKVAKWRQDQASKAEATAIQVTKAQEKLHAAETNAASKTKAANDEAAPASAADAAKRAVAEVRTAKKAASLATNVAQAAKSEQARSEKSVPKVEPSVTMVHRHGERQQPVKDITTKASAYQRGYTEKNEIRDHIAQSLNHIEALSPHARNYIEDHLDTLLQNSNHTSDATTAKSNFDRFIEDLSGPDQKLIRRHMESFTHKGYKYFETWKNKDIVEK